MSFKPVLLWSDALILVLLALVAESVNGILIRTSRAHCSSTYVTGCNRCLLRQRNGEQNPSHHILGFEVLLRAIGMGVVTAHTGL